jgi:nitric oxide reductase large subunit
MSDFEKEALLSIREITLQLVLIASGVLAFGAGFVALPTKTLTATSLVWVSFFFFITSIVTGILAYAALINQLQSGRFDAKDRTLLGLARAQWTCFIIGAVLVVSFAAFQVKRSP